jgi:hypothetical protein
VASQKPVTINDRTVHAIKVNLRTAYDNELSVIVWPADPPIPKHCAQLMNGRRTWITARARDAVLLSRNGQKTREHIESVELYRVFPASANGLVVTSAWHWLNPESR